MQTITATDRFTAEGWWTGRIFRPPRRRRRRRAPGPDRRDHAAGDDHLRRAGPPIDRRAGDDGAPTTPDGRERPAAGPARRRPGRRDPHGVDVRASPASCTACGSRAGGGASAVYQDVWNADIHGAVDSTGSPTPPRPPFLRHAAHAVVGDPRPRPCGSSAASARRSRGPSSAGPHRATGMTVLGGWGQSETRWSSWYPGTEYKIVERDSYPFRMEIRVVDFDGTPLPAGRRAGCGARAVPVRGIPQAARAHGRGVRRRRFDTATSPRSTCGYLNITGRTGRSSGAENIPVAYIDNVL